MKISIVMLVYNHERFIDQALESILMQQVNFDYELIVGEDCSVDHSKDVIKEYEAKFQGKMFAIYRKKNIGATQNLIDCLLKCKGKYIAFLEGDDYWTDKFKLQKLVDYLEANPQYSAVAHNYKIVNKSNEFLRLGLEYKSLYIFDKKELESYRLPSQTSTLLIRNIISKVKKEDLNKILKFKWMPGDRIFIFILLQYGKIAVLPEVMGAYRYYIETEGTNWSSQHKLDAIDNYFYTFRIICSMEQLSDEMKFPLDMMNAKVKLIRKAIKARRWSNHKVRLGLQCFYMFLIEKHKINFAKAVIKNFRG